MHWLGGFGAEHLFDLGFDRLGLFGSRSEDSAGGGLNDFAFVDGFLEVGATVLG